MTNDPSLLAKYNYKYPANLTDGTLLNEALAAAVKEAKRLAPGYEQAPMPFTDIGLAVFYTTAVAIFGPSISSPLKLMFALLLLSVAIFMAVFWRRILPSMSLLFVVSSLFLWARFLANNPTDVNAISLVGLRSISLVGVIAFLFLFLVLVTGEHIPTPMQAGVFFQAFLLWLAAVSRSSFLWAVIVVAAIVVLRPIVSALRGRRSGKRAQQLDVLPILILSLGLLTLSSIEIIKLKNAPILDQTLVSQLIGWNAFVINALALGIIGLGLACLVLVLLRAGLTHWNRKALTLRSPISTMIILGLTLPQVALMTFLPPLYFSADAFPHHLRWHNAVIGLEYSPKSYVIFKDLETGGVQVGEDATGFGASFLEFEKTLPEADRVKNAEGTWNQRAEEVGWNSGVTGTFKARATDLFAQRAFVNYLKSYPVEVLLAYPNKIRSLFSTLSTIYFQNLLPIAAFMITGLFGLAYGLFAPYQSDRALRSLRRHWLLTLVLSPIALLSVLPLIWAYPVASTMADSFVFLTSFALAATLAMGSSLGVVAREIFASNRAPRLP